jgi:hypothetical protein
MLLLCIVVFNHHEKRGTPMQSAPDKRPTVQQINFGKLGFAHIRDDRITFHMQTFFQDEPITRLHIERDGCDVAFHTELFLEEESSFFGMPEDISITQDGNRDEAYFIRIQIGKGEALSARRTFTFDPDLPRAGSHTKDMVAVMKHWIENSTPA